MTLLLISGLLICAWLTKQVLGAVVSQQVKGSIPDYTARRARSAAQRLPPDLSEAYEAEWLAELATLDAKPITAIQYAQGLNRAATEIAWRAGVPVTGSRSVLAAARTRDVASSATMLLLLAPLLSAIALITRLVHGRHPILARSVELGMGGRPFHRFRFATVKRSARGEIDMTRLGRFLYQSSLCELPALINLLRGDLSLVGPPSRSSRGALENRETVLRVRPGICSWQLLAAQGFVKLSADEAKYRDEHRTLLRDLAVILHTVKAVARAEF